MTENHERLDTGQLDMSTQDQTPDMSVDTAVSIREAAAQAGVTEKTVRRWIKSGRLHAVKLGGQYRITVADLERARDASATQHVQTVDTTKVDTGQETPRVDMSPRLDSGQGQSGQAMPDLRPLVDHIATLEGQVRQLTEAATAWQFRAMHLEEQLKQLTATVEAPNETAGSPESDETAEDVSTTHHEDDSTPPEGIWARLRQWFGGVTH